MDFYCKPSQGLTGTVRVPGDKSVSHRSIIFGAIADGVTRVSGFLEGEDALATLNAFRAMGVQIEGPNNGEVVIHGVGLHGLQSPSQTLDVGNSGTTIRLLTGLLAGQAFAAELNGDTSLAKRPMRRVTDPLTTMGASLQTSETGTPPVRVKPVAALGEKALQGITYTLPMASAQVKSALLLAGLYAETDTSVTEPAVTRDHTERMLYDFGVSVTSESLDEQRTTVTISPPSSLTAHDVEVPGDISSAAFLIVAALISPGSHIMLENVGVNPTRTGVLHILKAMGADITLTNERLLGQEPIADIVVKHSLLTGIEIPQAWVPLAIDEFPVLFIAASYAQGETVLSGAEELRVKESDRIQVMADGLLQLGVKTEPTADGIRIQGPQMVQGGEVECHHDHRIAMSFAVASLNAQAPVLIKNCEPVATSFPGFVELMNSLGLSLSVRHD